MSGIMQGGPRALLAFWLLAGYSAFALQLSPPRASLYHASPPLKRSSPCVMPIGVPKVAYKVPGAQYADWVCASTRAVLPYRAG